MGNILFTTNKIAVFGIFKMKTAPTKWHNCQLCASCSRPRLNWMHFLKTCNFI